MADQRLDLRAALRVPYFRLPRYHLLGGLMDFSLYVLFTAVPHRAMELGARDLELGLIPVVWAVPYVLVTAFGGGFGDRVPRATMARWGAALYATAAFLLAVTPGLPAIYLAVALVGIGLGGFWPALQAAIADASTDETLEKNLGNFNIAWSLGKGLGFLAGGWLYAAFGPTSTLALAAGMGIAVAGGVPKVASRRTPPPSLVNESDLARLARRRWRHLGWIANFGAWGLGATVIHLYPEMNHDQGRGAAAFGLVLTTIYLSQTVTFVILRRWRGWVYRVGPFLAFQLGGAALVAMIGLTDRFPLVLLAAAGVGASLGMGYYSSITYSLRTEGGRGKNTGRHEAALGSANFLLPLLGGLLVRDTGRLEAPYLAAAAVVLIGVSIQTVWMMRARTIEDAGASPEGEIPAPPG